MTTAHPGLPEFDYIKPKTLEEASRFLAQHPGQARPFLGGTDVFVRMRDGVWKDQYLVDVKGLDGTTELRYDAQNGLRLGAAVSMNQVICSPEVLAHYPLLADACRSVASYQLRTRATVAGNICNASPAGDTIGACLVFDGRLLVHGASGQREEPLSSFFFGPGKTTLKPGDVVTQVRLPVPHPGSRGKYIKLGRNALSDLSIVGVTALAYPDDTPSGLRFRLALASVAPTPLVARQAETILAENPLTDDVIMEAALAAMQACTPIDDVRGGAKYRKLMVRNLVRQAVTELARTAKPQEVQP